MNRNRAPQLEPVDERENYFSTALFPWLVIGYFWLYTATPHLSSLFSFFEVIHFERILLIILAISAVTTGRLRSVASPITGLYLLLFLWMLMSFLLTDYGWFENVRWWPREYWKFVVVFLLVAAGLKDKREVAFVLLGCAGVSTLYQLHTWYDYAGGGSYVYQQGIKRMIGVWSGGGVGSANAYAALALTSIPLGFFAYRTGWAPWVRLSGLGCMVLSVASILFSGTRGGFICGGLIVGMIMVAHTGAFRSTILAIVIASVSWALLPAELQERYIDIGLGGATKGMSKTEEISASSAQSRVEGLIDGFAMAADNPLFGQGPGSSEVARLKYRRLEQPLQLHNQIGQVVGELGYVGLLIWFSLLAVACYSAWSMARSQSVALYSRAAGQCLNLILIALVLYGAVTHNLYHYRWGVCFALLVALLRVPAERRRDSRRQLAAGANPLPVSDRRAAPRVA